MNHATRFKLIPLALCLALLTACDDKPLASLPTRPPGRPAIPVIPINQPPAPEPAPEPVVDVPQTPPSSEALSAAQANNKLAWALWAQLGAPDNKNIFYSPTSASQCLAMVALGTQGKTSDEIWSALGFSPGSDQAAQQSALRLALEQVQSDKVTFRCANGLWASSGDPLRPQYVEQARMLFAAAAQSLDFVQKQAAADTINRWAASQTNNKITQVIAPDLLGSETRLVLTNAVYFKADWATQFKKENTRKAPFKVEGKDEKPVNIMNASIPGRFANDGVFTMIELDYLQGRMVFRAVIANAPRPAGSEAAPPLDAQRVEDLKKRLHGTDIHVGLPRFTMEWEKELTPTFKALGMKQAFARGDFSPMFQATVDNTAITHVSQKAFVKVDEKGTEAAAVTSVVAGITSVQIEPTFYADRPFVFQIVEPKTDTIVFMGRVSDPKE